MSKSKEEELKRRALCLRKSHQERRLVAIPPCSKRKFNFASLKSIFQQVSKGQDLLLQSSCSETRSNSICEPLVKVEDDGELAMDSLVADYINSRPRIQQSEDSTNRSLVRIKAKQKISQYLVMGVEEIKRNGPSEPGDRSQIFGMVDLLSADIQKSCFELYSDRGIPSKKYPQKMKGLLRELKNPANVNLRERILRKQIAASRIFQMDQIQLVAPQRKKRLLQIKQSFMDGLTVRQKTFMQQEFPGPASLQDSQSSLAPRVSSKSSEEAKTFLTSELIRMMSSGPKKMRSIIQEQLPPEVSCLLLPTLGACLTDI